MGFGSLTGRMWNSKGLGEHLLKEVRSPRLATLSEDNLDFLNNSMRTCQGSIGQPRRRSCPSARLAAEDSCLTCNESVGLLRGIVVPCRWWVLTELRRSRVS